MIEEAEMMKVKKTTFARGLSQKSALEKFKITR
jgi:hypothetical protein